MKEDKDQNGEPILIFSENELKQVKIKQYWNRELDTLYRLLNLFRLLDTELKEIQAVISTSEDLEDIDGNHFESSFMKSLRKQKDYLLQKFFEVDDLIIEFIDQHYESEEK